jgi:excisionase family DNA binding protein
MPRPSGSDLLLNLAEAGWFLQLPEHTVRRLCREGRLPAERPGRNWHIRASQLEPLLGAIARRRLDQVRRGELTIPAPTRRSGVPASLTQA